MEKTAKKILIGTGAAVAGAAAAVSAFLAVTDLLVKVALDREVPVKVKNMDKTMDRLTGSSEIREMLAATEDAAKKLEDCGCETIRITAHDGEKLVGHWRGVRKAKRTIIAMHGWRSSWSSDFGTVADFWYENGCNVLYAEQRGQGESGGEYMGFGLLERYDCLDWIKWVNERCGAKLPVYLGGVSMGATTVLMASGLELPENVRGIVADCGFTSPHAIWKHVAEHNLHVSYGIHAAAANDLCKKKIQVGAKDYSTVEAMEQCKIPVLFIHGTDDAFVPVKMTYENYKACVAPKRLFVVPGAGHGMSYYSDKNGYEKVLREFWEEFD